MSRQVQPRFKLPSKRRRSKAARDAVELRAVRLALLERSQGRCEAGFVLGCTGVGTQAHHVQRRSQGSDNSLEGLLWVCLICHEQIHHHPALATERGLLQPGYIRP